MNADRIRLALDEMEVRIMREKSGRTLFACPAAASDDARKICRLLGLKRGVQPFVYFSTERSAASAKKILTEYGH